MKKTVCLALSVTATRPHFFTLAADISTVYIFNIYQSPMTQMTTESNIVNLGHGHR